MTLRLKKTRHLPWIAIFDLAVVGALCACIALVLPTALSPGKKATPLVSTLAHGPASVTIKPPKSFDIPLINNFSGNEVNLQPGQLVWTFNQNIERSGKISPATYPNSGPCTVNYARGHGAAVESTLATRQTKVIITCARQCLAPQMLLPW